MEIRIEDLWVSYRRAFRRDVVLKGVEMKAKPGEIAAIIGRNGVGKTTLFRTLLGFQAADRGRISIDGLASYEYRQERGIGYVPEVVAFPVAWTVGDILGRGVDMAVPAPDRSEAVSLAIRRAGFDQVVLSKHANRCSKGIQQRLKLAYALIGEPCVVLLDEPFSGLDPPSRIALRNEIITTSERGTTVLLASHDLAEVARLAHTVFIMEDGKMRRGPPPDSDGSGLGTDLENILMDGEQ